VIGTPIDPTILIVISGLAAAVVAILALVKWHQAVLAAVGRAFKALFSFNGFFWIVNLSCMAYSAQNAGYVFGLYEYSGFAIGLALDGLIIVFTQTALAAKARGEMRRAALILLFIVGCCLLSTIGNLAHNLHTDISSQTSGVWFQQVIPYITSLMPLLLIALAWVADLKIDPLEKEDPEVYKSNEKKRLQFQSIQIESSERREALQTRAIAVEQLRRRNSALRRGKVPGSFRWFWEKALDPGEIIAGVSAQLAALFNPQIADMKRELETLREEKASYLALVEQANAEKMLQFQKAICAYVDRSLETVRVDLARQNERYCQALVQQNEQYRLALGEQYSQDITLVKAELSGQIDDTLAVLKTTISRDVEGLKETFDLVIHAKQSTAKLNTVIEMTSEIEAVLMRFPNVASWLSGTVRSVSLQDIIDATNLSSQLVHRRAKAGAFRATKRAGYYRLDSVLTWLKTAPLPQPKERDNQSLKEQDMAAETEQNGLPTADEIEANGREEIVPNGSDVVVEGQDNQDLKEQDMVAETVERALPITDEIEAVAGGSIEKSGDKLAMTVAAMRENPSITDAELASILSLKRPASARFWKVKAKELLEKEQPMLEEVHA
jgi:hypothetical protein